MENVKKQKTYEVDMVNGHIFLNMIKFCVPLMLTGILQLIYNAADLIIVGNFSGDKSALGAVGSTTSLINLMINFFMGLSVGTNVLVARKYAVKDGEGLKRVIHTAVLISLLSGLFLGLFGFIFAKDLLRLMSNPIDLAITYLKIYFIGLPFNMLYNFAAAILRGIGDTKRPLYYLSFAGIINVILNLVFVICFKMSVAGVALATIIAQAISCILIMACLMKTKDIYKFRFKDLKLSGYELKEMMKIGLPAGIQNSIFAISNVLIQSSVNMFDKVAGTGSTVINGNSAAVSIEDFVYMSMDSVFYASLSFTSQNVAARRKDNLPKVLIASLSLVVIIGLMIGVPAFIFGKSLLKIYTTDPVEIEVAYIRLHYLCLPYFLCGIMDVMSGSLKGLGYSILPMVVSIVGVCGFRVLWIYAVFRQFTDFSSFKDLNILYVSYPISWIITFIAHFICYGCVIGKVKKEMDLVLE